MTTHSSLPPSSALLAASVGFLEDLYARWQDDPASVDAGWHSAFLLAQQLVGEGHAGDAAAALRRFGHLGAATDPLSPAGSHAQAGEREQLRRDYCGALSVETGHLDDAALVRWIEERMERRARPGAPALVQACERLVAAEELERFLGLKFPGKKRFGAEGAESLVAFLLHLFDEAAARGIEEVVLGTMHRGRLNILVNVLGKPLDTLVSEIKEAHPFAGTPGGEASAADVPYHLGYEADLVLGGRRLHVQLLPNPSHLEAIGPVVLGRVRASQDLSAPADAARVLGVVLHTDAAVVGQGVVAESLQFAGVEGFTTAGTVHLVVNNQIGFTTEPYEARTSRYCTGPWRATDSLILHANGDDIEAVLQSGTLALDYRQAHRRDAVVDLVCYRRNGHNEIDEPRFTQPQMYERIAALPGVATRLRRQLQEAGLLSQQSVDDMVADLRASMASAYERGVAQAARAPSGHAEEPAVSSVANTGVPKAQARQWLDQMARVPDGFQVGPKLHRLVAERAEGPDALPWAVGEGLAIASLLADGRAVRLTGQDVARGAFSHRHLVLTDIRTGARHNTLDALPGMRARFTVANSPLSEFAVMGFEYGYSLGALDALVVWEAQFGDFANGAQVMVDQFVAAGLEKWGQASRLVILLPHGLEGQGPEHSSARIERFLQLAAQDNLRLAIPTTPANYFHLLRQHAATGRAPLVVFAPKTLLRLPAAVSSIDDFAPPNVFRPVVVSEGGATATRLLVCCGKLAYDLERERDRRKAAGVHIVRLEQLYPLPTQELAEVLGRSPRAELLWVQEEPENMGAWTWMDRRLEAVAASSGHVAPRWRYCGRPESASPAGSFHGRHMADQAAIVSAAFD